MNNLDANWTCAVDHYHGFDYLVLLSALRVEFSVAAVTLVGCDPVVNIAGANFPAWLLCAVVGVIMTAVLKPALAAIKIEPFLEPLILIYPCLATVLACLVYLIFFNRL